MLNNLKIKAEYRNDNRDVTVTLSFTDRRGHIDDTVWLSTYKGRINVHWGTSSDKSLENARIYAEAIDLIVKAAEIIASGRRLEEVWQRDDLEII
jgi:hypothetical protein